MPVFICNSTKLFASPPKLPPTIQALTGEVKEEVLRPIDVSELISDEFEDLDSNPWYYDDLHDFINRWLEEKGEKGHLYRFDGTYVKFKNENFRFSGKVKEVKL